MDKLGLQKVTKWEITLNKSVFFALLCQQSLVTITQLP